MTTAEILLVLLLPFYIRYVLGAIIIITMMGACLFADMVDRFQRK